MEAARDNGSSYVPIEDLEVFKLFEEIADWAWDEVEGWSHFRQNTVGIQLVRSADSVGANLSEGDGRHSELDSLRFLRIARGSAREVRTWLNRCKRRRLAAVEVVDAQLEKQSLALKFLNKLIGYRVNSHRPKGVRENRAAYAAALEVEDI